MFKRNHQPKDIFTEALDSLMGSGLLFGVALIILAVLIFLYPALLGFIFATLILLVGVGTLYGAYQLHQFKKHINHVENEVVPVYAEVRTEGPYYRQRKVTMILR